MSYFNYRAAGIDPSKQAFNLQPHINELVDYQDISDLVDEDTERRIVDYVRTISAMSYEQIKHRYPYWLEADRAHDLYVPAETTAFREKAVIADTRAVADTVGTYFMSAITGRNPMFQLEGLNRDSRRTAALLERVLHQQNRSCAIELNLAQFFLDSIRYGFAPSKIVWDAKQNTNRFVNHDPRRTFPDPRANLGDVEGMGFVVFSDHASSASLRRTGLYPKLNKYPQMLDNNGVVSAWPSHEWHKESGKGWNVNRRYESQSAGESGFFQRGRSHVIDEAWVVLQGYEVGLPSIDQLWMVITIIDERFVIRCQLSPHGQQLPLRSGGFGFDQHKTYHESLYDLLMPLHEIGTWLLRSRVDNVQAAMSNLMFVDPTRVAVHDLVNRNPYGLVRTLPGQKPGDGVHIAQVPDVTKGHWNDIQALGEMKQRISAASDAQQGMPTSDGIRSATEIKRLTQLGSQRLGVLSRIMSARDIRALVRMQVANIQDSLRFDGSVKVPDSESNPAIRSLSNNGYVDLDIDMLQGEVEYLVVDGTLPMEPTRSPETWMKIVEMVNTTGLVAEYDMGLMVEEGIRSMGVPDVQQFRIDQERLKDEGLAPHQQLALMEKARGASTVMPQEQLMQQVQAGNMVPVSESR